MSGAEREQDFLPHRVVTLELNFDFGLQLRDACRLQDYALAQGDDGGACQFLTLGKEFLLSLQQQDICRCVQKEPELIGREAAAGHAVSLESVLHFLYVQLAVAAFAVPVLIDGLRLLRVHVRDHEADILALVAELYLHNNPLRLFPARGAVHEAVVDLLVLACHLVLFLSTGNPCCHALIEALVAGEAEDIVQMPLALGPLHELAAGEHTVSTNRDFRVGPELAQIGYQADEQAGHVVTLVGAARTQYAGYQLAAVTLEDIQGHVAVLTVVGIENRELLCAVAVVVAVVKVEDNPVGGFVVGLHEVTHEKPTDVVQLLVLHMVLQPCHRGLRAEGIVAGKSARGKFHHAVVAKQVAVVGILIPGGYLEHTLGNHLLYAVGYQLGGTPLKHLAGNLSEQIVTFNYTAKNGQTAQICHVGSRKANLDLLIHVKQIKKICLHLLISIFCSTFAHENVSNCLIVRRFKVTNFPAILQEMRSLFSCYE